jgi:hypothetical protein
MGTYRPETLLPWHREAIRRVVNGERLPAVAASLGRSRIRLSAVFYSEVGQEYARQYESLREANTAAPVYFTADSPEQYVP